MMRKAKFFGFLSNSYTSALVSPEGSIEWLPFPRFDDDAVLCRILDESEGGFCSVKPSTGYTVSQRYVPRTLILETKFDTAAGRASVHDFLAIGHPTLWRQIKTDVPLVLTCHPTFNFGSASSAYELTENGAHFLNPVGSDGINLVIEGAHEKLPKRDQWLIYPGTVSVVMQYSRYFMQERKTLFTHAPDGGRVEEIIAKFWDANLVPYEGPYRSMFNQSVLVLRGLTYRTNGALLAAATTSLPESIGETRQWDYRFVWVRDGAYGAEALLLAGDAVGCRRFLEFMLNTIDLVDKPYPSPFYRVDGTRIQGESELLWLAGYKNSRPVRVGNGAASQVQLDIEGDLVWSLFLYWKETHDNVFIKDYWWAVVSLVEWTKEQWQQPDASLWEFRDDDDYYLHSQVMCWVVVKAGAVLAELALGDEKLSAQWENDADAMWHAIWKQWESLELPYFVQGHRHHKVDAALLTLPLYDFLPASHPVFLRTLSEIEKRLVHDDTVFRYESDNMGAAHYPFTIAGFWLARVYLRLGRLQDADRVIARQMNMATNLGLFAEHVDPVTNEPHGNFPQLFPHAAVLTTLVERQRFVDKKPLWTLSEGLS